MNYSTIKDSLKLLGGEIDPGKKLELFAKLLRRKTGFDLCAICIFQKESGAYILRGASGKTKNLDDFIQKCGAPLNLKTGTNRVIDVSRALPKKPEGVFKSAFAYVMPDKANPGLIFLIAKKKVRISAQTRELLELISLEIAAAERMRAKLAGYEKIASLGDMAATLVHELKNPILSIGGYAARLRQHLKDGPEAMRCLSELTAETKRLEGLTGGMINFLREGPIELKPNDLNLMVAEAVSFLDEEFRSRAIEIRLALQEGLVPILADRVQLKIAFDNIITNAIQSMEKGGIMTIETRLAGNSAEVTFTDTGGGIDPALINSIFNPLFTTKKRGTGLGLSIVNTIVSRHNGTIDIDNRAGIGVGFTLKFARSAAISSAGKN